MVPFGNFTGGELCFPTIGLKVKMEPGDLVAFDSFNMPHSVAEHEDERYSLVFHQHQTMFFQAIPKAQANGTVTTRRKKTK